jgi:RNA polymerase sigma factor (sigma-70 family)
MATIASEVPSLARDRAFETLYRSYVQDVYHYALALLRNPADAEDVTQTTFMNAYRAFKRGEDPLKPHNWLIRIAHNVARSRYAMASRRVKEVPLDDHLEHLSLPEENKPDVEAVLVALGRLPLNQRAALVLRELEGRSYAEIADTLSVSVPAVETLIFRARRALRLKASAIRSLGLVPLPSSLAQLLESGPGVAVGGSALFGSGFLLKALVAIVAGGAVTGLVGGTQTHGAPAATPAVAHAAQRLTAKAQPTGKRSSVRASLRIVHGQAVDSVARPDSSRQLPGPEATTAASTGQPVASSSTPASSSNPTSTPSVNQVTSAVSTVTTSTTPLPALPQVTTVPAVSLPPPPPLPKLP